MGLVTCCDVISGTRICGNLCVSTDFLLDKCESSVVSIKISEIMPARCVAANCGNFKDVSKNISLHAIPYFGDTRPEAQKRRRKWVEWVKLKRAKWEPSKHSHLCSVHFKETDFIWQFGSEVALTNRSLLRDEIGVCVYPCYHTAADREKPLSERDKRMVRKTFYVRVTYKACCS